MTNNVLETKSMQRLQGILQSRYGKSLEVRYIIDAAAMNWNGSEANLNGRDLVIPIELHGVFLGMARVPAASDLPKTSLQAITEVVRLILEPSLYSRYLDNRAAELHKQDFIGDDQELHLAGHAASVTKNTNSAAVLLVSENPNTLARVARVMHEDSERWAFLSYSDMKCHLGSVEEIKALGKASIFVEDLLLMSPTELEVLTQYLECADVSLEPMIIIGSTRDFEQIQKTGHYAPELVKILAPYVADLKRWPSEEHLLKQALDLLIQPLALSGL